MVNIRTFVINLDTEHVRRNKIISHLNQLGIDFEIFNAHRWNGLPRDIYHYFYDNKGQPHNPSLTYGEIGCYASHLSIFKQLSEDKEGGCYFVLEDDAILDSRAPIIIECIKMWASKLDFDFINFRHLKRSCPVKNFSLEDCDNIYLSLPWIPSLSGVSYIITHQGAIKYFLYLKDVMNNKIVYPFDVDFRNAFFENYLNILEVVGFSLNRMNFESSIDKESFGKKRIRHMKKKEIIYKALIRHGVRYSYKIFCFFYHSYRSKILYKILKIRE